MLITKNFIVLNLPKTGSTFVTTVVRNILLNRIKESFFSKVLFKLGLNPNQYEEILLPHPILPNFKDQHGGYIQIPPKYSNREIVTVIRSPYDRFMSQYQYKWWAKNDVLEQELLKEHFPSFPELTLDDYVLYRELLSKKTRELNGLKVDKKIGDQSIQFIKMFHKSPSDAFLLCQSESIDYDKLFDGFAKITFLKQENLNDELAHFLMIHGFSKSECDFVSNHNKVNVSKRNSGNLSNMAIEYIESSEQILFEMLHRIGIKYEKPSLN